MLLKYQSVACNRHKTWKKSVTQQLSHFLNINIIFLFWQTEKVCIFFRKRIHHRFPGFFSLLFKTTENQNLIHDNVKYFFSSQYTRQYVIISSESQLTPNVCTVGTWDSRRKIRFYYLLKDYTNQYKLIIF